MSFESLIKKTVAKNPSIAPVKLKRRNAQPEAIEQSKVITRLEKYRFLKSLM